MRDLIDQFSIALCSFTFSNQNCTDDSHGTSSPSTVQSYDDPLEYQAPDDSVDSGYGTSYLIKVRGLPWTATKKDLLDFFANVHISNGFDGIHFITDDQNNFGVAYIQLPTRKDYDRAQNFHHKLLGDRYVEGKRHMNREQFIQLSKMKIS